MSTEVTTDVTPPLVIAEKKQGTNGVDVAHSLELIARKLPGRGHALGELIRRAKLTHVDISRELGLSRATVTQWISETRWPSAAKILKTLTLCGISREQLEQIVPALFGAEVPRDVQHAIGGIRLLEVSRAKMLSVLQETSGSFEQVDLIYETFRAQVVLAMSLRASGMQGAEGASDRAIQTWLAEYRIHSQEKARRGQAEERIVTTPQAELHAGVGVYKEKPNEVKPNETTQDSVVDTAQVSDDVASR